MPCNPRPAAIRPARTPKPAPPPLSARLDEQAPAGNMLGPLAGLLRRLRDRARDAEVRLWAKRLPADNETAASRNGGAA
jgi:hypothetical protein